MELIATSAFGLEKVVYKELKALNFWVTKTENGRVTFESDELGICRANLWLRTADRVLLKLAEFEASTFDQLFDEVQKIDWAEYIEAESAFPVKADSHDSILHSEPAIQSIVKKAIVEKLKKKYKLQQFPENKALCQIIIKINKNQCLVSLDTSGIALHKRGYREEAASAPIKETLAAAIILLSDWDPKQNKQPLIDPFCGSGTIPIEAAMIAQNRAPGLLRNFSSQEWNWIGEKNWQTALREAQEKFNPQEKFNIIGFDNDENSIKIAENNMHKAQLNRIKFEEKNFHNIKLNNKDNGCVITNPPYGERMQSQQSIANLYETLGENFKNLPDWSLHLITSYNNFEKKFGKKADKNRKLFNGKIQCYLYQYFGKKTTDLAK